MENTSRPCPFCHKPSSFREVHLDSDFNVIPGPSPGNPSRTLHEYSCTCGWAELNIPDENLDAGYSHYDDEYDDFLEDLEDYYHSQSDAEDDGMKEWDSNGCW